MDNLKNTIRLSDVIKKFPSRFKNKDGVVIFNYVLNKDLVDIGNIFREFSHYKISIFPESHLDEIMSKISDNRNGLNLVIVDLTKVNKQWWFDAQWFLCGNRVHNYSLVVLYNQKPDPRFIQNCDNREEFY